jgi:DNA-binding CsgD family transcriptional regulator
VPSLSGTAAEAASLTVPEVSAEESVLRADEDRLVLRGLAGLPQRQREALILRYYQRLSETEIAAVMGISRGTVKSTTARGLAALGPHQAGYLERAAGAGRGGGRGRPGHRRRPGRDSPGEAGRRTVGATVPGLAGAPEYYAEVEGSKLDGLHGPGPVAVVVRHPEPVLDERW